MQIKYNSLDNFFENMEQKNSEEIIAFLNELKVDNLCHNTLFQKAVLNRKILTVNCLLIVVS